MKRQVFLGGACGATTWRRDVAIPALEAAGVTYHDPQLGIGEWTPAHEADEMAAKADAAVYLFVVDGTTRGVASVAEVGYLIGAGRPLALCLADLAPGALIDGHPIGDPERDDLNRGRVFIRTMAVEHGVPVFARVADAVAHAVALLGPPPPINAAEVRTILAAVAFKQHRFVVDDSDGRIVLRIEYDDLDAETARPSEQRGRGWLIDGAASKSDVVRTAFKAVATSQEHVARELFRYRGAPVFGPHFDVDGLAALHRAGGRDKP